MGLRETGQLALMTRVGSGEESAATFYSLGPNAPPVRRAEQQPQVGNAYASPDGKRLLFSRGSARNPFTSPPESLPPPKDKTGLYVLDL
jgi:hypothetical protein